MVSRPLHTHSLLLSVFSPSENVTSRNRKRWQDIPLLSQGVPVCACGTREQKPWRNGPYGGGGPKTAGTGRQRCDGDLAENFSVSQASLLRSLEKWGVFVGHPAALNRWKEEGWPWGRHLAKSAPPSFVLTERTTERQGKGRAEIKRAETKDVENKLQMRIHESQTGRWSFEMTNKTDLFAARLTPDNE